MRGIRFRPDAGAPLVVFNFHSWAMTGPVEFTVSGDPRGLTLRDGGGRETPWQLVSPGASGETRLAFVADAVPACGYRTYYLSRGEAAGPARPTWRPGAGPIESDRYRAELDAQGQLRVTDTTRNVPVGAVAGGLGEVVLDDTPRPTDWMMNGPVGPRHVWEPQRDASQFMHGPVFSALRAAGKLGPHTVGRELRLWQTYGESEIGQNVTRI